MRACTQLYIHGLLQREPTAPVSSGAPWKALSRLCSIADMNPFSVPLRTRCRDWTAPDTPQSSPSDQPGEAGQTPRGSDLDQRVRRDIGSAMTTTSSRAGGYVRAGHRPERVTQRDPAYAPCADRSLICYLSRPPVLAE